MWFLIATMAIQTILELELGGRGQGWTDKSADLARSPVEIRYGIEGNGIVDRTAGTGTAAFELVNVDPQGRYSLRHANKVSGFNLGIGVRIRLLTANPAGSGSGYLINNAGGYSAGTTTVDIDTGTGSILKDDIVTFAGVAGEYVVTLGGDTPTSITFEPGLAGSVADDAAIALVKRNYTRFRGRLDTVRPIAGIFERQTVRCTGVDWFDDAARAKLSRIPVQVNRRADQLFSTLVDAVSFSPDAVEIIESPDTYAHALDNAQDEKTTVLSELQKLALSELGYIYQKADGVVVFESRIARSKSSGVVDTFVDTSTLSDFDQGSERNDAVRKLQLITHVRKVDDVDTTVLFSLTSPFKVPASTTSTVLGPYRDPNQEAARVGGTDMRTPVAVTDYVANAKSDGSGEDLTAFVNLTVTFGGNGAKIEVENTTPKPAFLTKLQLRGRGIFDFQNVIAEAEDEATTIGNSLSVDMPYQDDPILGGEAAIWLLTLYKDFDNMADSATVIVPRSDDTLADRVLTREISDRIGVVEQMTGFPSSPVEVFFINSVALVIDQLDNISITWGLAPADRSEYWLLEVPGKSELDQTTILGFGLVTGHADVAHCDAPHDDVAHDDSHTDTHEDAAHADAAHGDAAHSDTPHSDTAHGDTAHSDTSHSDNHSDGAHEDTHSDMAHSDVLHDDSHGDAVEGDAGIHTDTHDDVAHDDVAHDDSHGDVAHDDSHGDTAHNDTAHDDVAHEDINHSDMPHSDSGHADAAHADSHGDVAHDDVDHQDTEHCDTAHGDGQI